MKGYAGALVAGKRLAGRKHLLVVYQETDATDGFIVTANFAKRLGRKDSPYRVEELARRRAVDVGEASGTADEGCPKRDRLRGQPRLGIRRDVGEGSFGVRPSR
jgi:hypothetical protein